jgi:hypothetical protein
MRERSRAFNELSGRKAANGTPRRSGARRSPLERRLRRARSWRRLHDRSGPSMRDCRSPFEPSVSRSERRRRVDSLVLFCYAPIRWCGWWQLVVLPAQRRDHEKWERYAMVESNLFGDVTGRVSRSTRRPALGFGAVLVGLLSAFMTLGCGAAQPEEEPATSQAELKQGGDPRLARYEETYLRWSYGGMTLPTDAHGNAVEKNIVMLPIPPAPGDGTPATANVTLSAGEGFVLPLFAGLGTSYRDGTPPDPFEPTSIFTTLQLDFAVDGKTLIDTSNVLRYFTKFDIQPAIPIDDPVVKAIIWFEGVGVLHNPLCPGRHTLTLDVKNVEPSFGQLLEYHNTWNITVKPGR